MDYYFKFNEMKQGESYYMTNGRCNFKFTKITDFQFIITIGIYLDELEETETFTKVITSMAASIIAEKLQ